MPRFVVLEHDRPGGLHWDFMLETGSVLATWALAQAPDSADSVPAERLADHRTAYLEYEGPISGGRGSVTQWDRGTYEVQRQSDTELAVTVSGEKLIGRAALARLPNEAGQWRFSFVAEQEAAGR